MFPPVEQKILQSNPEFAKLYRIITTAILNPDGSTKEDDEAKDRATVQKVNAILLLYNTCFKIHHHPSSINNPFSRTWTNIARKPQSTTS